MIFYLITVLWKVCLSEALEIESNETVLIKEDIEGDHGLEKYANMTNVDHFFLTILGIIVFFMQCGFGFLEAGAVRSKNTVNILIKNWLDMCLGAIAYWAVGFGLTWGEFGNGFCGGSYYFGVNVPDYLLSKFFFQFTFAATASTLVSGALAERCNFIAYLVYCNLITGTVTMNISWGLFKLYVSASSVILTGGLVSHLPIPKSFNLKLLLSVNFGL